MLLAPEAYQILSLGMRYVFLTLTAYIVLQLVLQSLAEHRLLRRKKLEAAGAACGYLEVSAPDSLAGERFVLYREVVIGAARRCDICVKKAGLSPAHAALYEKKGSIYLSNQGGRGGVCLNDEPVKKKDKLVLSGDRINLGRLELYLYIGEPEAQHDQEDD